MNYLAHAYLSFNHPQILVGNMISDHVKGSAQYSYAQAIQKGIWLHRQIDTYTDAHQALMSAKDIFRPAYRLYASPIIDILMDHFLANDKNEFPSNELFSFTQQVYQTLEDHSAELPIIFSTIFPYMRYENWLLNYGNEEGIKKSLRGLVRRATYLRESETAFALFQSHYTQLQQCFDNFFPDVKRFAKEAFLQLVD